MESQKPPGWRTANPRFEVRSFPRWLTPKLGRFHDFEKSASPNSSRLAGLLRSGVFQAPFPPPPCASRDHSSTRGRARRAAPPARRRPVQARDAGGPRTGHLSAPRSASSGAEMLGTLVRPLPKAYNVPHPAEETRQEIPTRRRLPGPPSRPRALPGPASRGGGRRGEGGRAHDRAWGRECAGGRGGFPRRMAKAEQVWRVRAGDERRAGGVTGTRSPPRSSPADTRTRARAPRTRPPRRPLLGAAAAAGVGGAWACAPPWPGVPGGGGRAGRALGGRSARHPSSGRASRCARCDGTRRPRRAWGARARGAWGARGARRAGR